MGWTKGFFNAAYYDRELKPRVGGLAGRESDFIERVLAPEPGAVLLDLGSGAGRHAVELARRGYRLIGLELSAEYNKKAGESARRRKAGSLALVRADMRRIPLAPGSADGAYCVFSSFGYFSDQENAAVIRELSEALKPGARLLIEVHNRDHFVLLADDPRTQCWERTVGRSLYKGVYEFDPVTSRGVETVIQEAPKPGGPWTSSVRLYSVHELIGVLESNGFEALSLFDGLKEAPFHVLSHRMAVLARRNEQTGQGGEAQGH